MINSAPLIGISLVAVLVERLVLDPRIGRTRLADSRTPAKEGVRLLAECGIVPGMLTGGIIVAWIANELLRRFGASYCYTLCLIGGVAALAIAGERLLARWRSFEQLNRIMTKAMVVSSLLGLMIVVPFAGDTAKGTVSFLQSITAGVLTGGSFVFIRLLYDGVSGAFVYGRDKNGPEGVSLAREIVVAGLLALVLCGVAVNLNIFW